MTPGPLQRNIDILRKRINIWNGDGNGSENLKKLLMKHKVDLHGSKIDRIAKEIADSLHYRDGKMYCLDAYCIMSNHVHVVFTPLPIQSSDVAQTVSLHANDNDTQTK